jgi:UDP-N-acetylglucosamine 2-epimerase (non-hydrolysing)
MKSILTVIGTRPEAIKLAPLLSAISRSKFLENRVCISNQHTDLLDPFLLKLNIRVDYQLKSYEHDGSLYQSAAKILDQFGKILIKAKPDLVIVQGDTTTAFIAALAAFYEHVPVAHIEAGLRTGHLYSPWPEEAHRGLIDRLATYYFSPTEKAKNALLAEGISSEKIWMVGNTSIDALRLARDYSNLTSNSQEKFIVVTVHRRENHGEPLKEICHALQAIVREFADVKIAFLLHPNPSVRKTIVEVLSGKININLIEPLDHVAFIQLLDKCKFIITDSGGLQEEATFIGKPVLIVRDTTERQECVQAGTARLVGTNALNIISCCRELLENEELITAMSKVHYPFGDGYASERIVKVLEQELTKGSI